MAPTEPNQYWQQDDKVVMGKILLTIGAFAGIMTVVAIVIGFVI